MRHKQGALDWALGILTGLGVAAYVVIMATMGGWA